jgi:hypothetical protein
MMNAVFFLIVILLISFGVGFIRSSEKISFLKKSLRKGIWIYCILGILTLFIMPPAGNIIEKIFGAILQIILWPMAFLVSY